MRIEEIIEESIVALFSSNAVGEPLFLKGGAALKLSEGINARLSTDIDFSTPKQIEFPDQYFSNVKETLQKHFKSFELEVIDVKYQHKPKRRRRNQSEYWGGWRFTFKLSPKSHRYLSHETRRRRALIPEGSAGSTIEIDISEWEYCDDFETKNIRGIDIKSYSSTLLILEKIRAICQQHPAYKYSGKKNRVRDYFDIYSLLRKYRSQSGFFETLAKQLPFVFRAKEVPLDLLDAIFEPAFIELQDGSFRELKDTVKERLEEFPFYLEQLRFLINRLKEGLSVQV